MTTPQQQGAPQVRTPARFVPLAAIAMQGPDGSAIPITANNPLPAGDKPLGTVRALSADAPTQPGRAVLVDCSAQGIITLEMADGTQLPISFNPGLTLLPFAIRARRSLGTTAQANAWVLD